MHKHQVVKLLNIFWLFTCGIKVTAHTSESILVQVNVHVKVNELSSMFLSAEIIYYKV